MDSKAQPSDNNEDHDREVEKVSCAGNSRCCGGRGEKPALLKADIEWNKETYNLLVEVV